MSPPKHHDFTRRRTEPLGVDTTAAPVEVEPEITNSGPPPGPPSAADWATLGIGERLAELRDGQERQAVAIERVWGARHDDARVTRMENRLDRAIPNLERAVAVLDHWVPQLQIVMATSARQWDEFTRSQAKLNVFLENEWPRAQHVLDDLGSALRDLVGRVGRVEQTLIVVQSRNDAVWSTVNAIDVRVTKGERDFEAMSGRLAAIEKKHSDAALIEQGEKQVIAKGLKWASALKGLIAAIVLAATWLLSKFANK